MAEEETRENQELIGAAAQFVQVNTRANNGDVTADFMVPVLMRTLEIKGELESVDTQISQWIVEYTKIGRAIQQVYLRMQTGELSESEAINQAQPIILIRRKLSQLIFGNSE